MTYIFAVLSCFVLEQLAVQLKEAHSEHSTHSSAVTELTSKLAALTEELDEIKDSMNDRVRTCT